MTRKTCRHCKWFALCPRPRTEGACMHPLYRLESGAYPNVYPAESCETWRPRDRDPLSCPAMAFERSEGYQDRL